jgi:hypothetical protein
VRIEYQDKIKKIRREPDFCHNLGEAALRLSPCFSAINNRNRSADMAISGGI